MSLKFKLARMAHQISTDASLACTTWSGPEAARADSLRIRNVDVVVMMLLAALPWSATATSILGAAVFLCIFPTIRVGRLLAIIRRPAGALPAALVLLAAVGTLWASGVPWSERLGAFEKMAKFLLLPLLLLHFQYSQRASWMFVTFVGSNVILLAYSFLVAALPTLAMVERLNQPGVPVRNYIDQSQGFTFVAVALAGLAYEMTVQKKYYLAAGLGLVAGLFFANLAFVDIARTAFFYGPIMLVLLIMRYARRNVAMVGFLALAIAIGGLWKASPNLQRKVSAIFTELRFQPDVPVGEQQPSAALRLEFWRKSLRFFEAAPVLGHGTGSVKQLFRQDSIGQTGLSAVVVSNPHNQTLAAAVQWGIIGIVTIWTMWLAHARLFHTSKVMVAWIGMLATAQNVASSIFNSHLMDSYEGWLYVLAVGIAGGELLRSSGDANTCKLLAPKSEGAQSQAPLVRKIYS